jgi:small subunit ribosomal protein S20
MANTAQARKRARQAVKQNAHNSSQRSTLRTAIKAVRKAIEGGDKAAASQVFQSSISTIDRIADKKIIHKNKAARHKSRLAAALKALALVSIYLSVEISAERRLKNPHDIRRAGFIFAQECTVQYYLLLEGHF